VALHCPCFVVVDVVVGIHIITRKMMAPTHRRGAGQLRSHVAAVVFVVVFALLVGVSSSTVQAWEWREYVVGGWGGGREAGILGAAVQPQQTLTREEITLMRVRDLKRHLTRNHGYSQGEVSRILDKKELIETLYYEEEKVRTDKANEVKRNAVLKALLASAVAVLAVFLWPLVRQAVEIASVNFVVYTDKKRYEASRCMEHGSAVAGIGFSLMFILDLLQAWLTTTVLLSWVIRRSKYFFPTPTLSVRPGQFLGKEVAQSPVGNYGVNIGPMLVTWAMRFLHRKIEAWTGRALVRSQRVQRQAAREGETPEERTARRAARKEAKRAAREAEAARVAFAKLAVKAPSNQMPSAWMEPVSSSDGQSAAPAASETHADFLQEIDDHRNGVDESELFGDDDDNSNSGLDALD